MILISLRYFHLFKVWKQQLEIVSNIIVLRTVCGDELLRIIWKNPIKDEMWYLKQVILE